VPVALNFTMTSLDGKAVELSKYQGKVVLMVNVASECGLTPQYKGLQALHEKYGKDGLAVLGFPANEFGGQEPGTNAEIAAFCQKNYGVKFDMFAKVVVQGDGQCPLYKYLTSKETNPKFAGPLQWNFEKFLIGRNGAVVARFSPQVEPQAEEVTKAIEKELAKK
jgi:glutathione peroxidase